MLTLELPPKVQIDKHIPSGYVIRGYTEKEMLSYALEFSLEYNKQLTQRIIELESELDQAIIEEIEETEDEDNSCLICGEDGGTTCGAVNCAY